MTMGWSSDPKVVLVTGPIDFRAYALRMIMRNRCRHPTFSS